MEGFDDDWPGYGEPIIIYHWVSRLETDAACPPQKQFALKQGQTPSFKPFAIKTTRKKSDLQGPALHCNHHGVTP